MKRSTDGMGYPATYVLAGSLNLLAGVLALFLRRPGTEVARAAAPAAAVSPPATPPPATT
jgi:hypothetical protein